VASFGRGSSNVTKVQLSWAFVCWKGSLPFFFLLSLKGWNPPGVKKKLLVTVF